MSIKSVFIISLISFELLSCKDNNRSNQDRSPSEYTESDSANILNNKVDSLSSIDLWLTGNVEELLDANFSAKYSDRNSVLVYTIFKKNVSVDIVLKAFDSTGVEIGRSRSIVDEEKGKSKYLLFDFEKIAPLYLAKYYTFEIVPK